MVNTPIDFERIAEATVDAIIHGGLISIEHCPGELPLAGHTFVWSANVNEQLGCTIRDALKAQLFPE